MLTKFKLLLFVNQLIFSMGRGRKKHFRKGRDSGKTTSKHSSKDGGQRQAYKDIVKDNENFVKYYKVQGIVPPEEWESFMNSLRECLPTTFRITGYRGYPGELAWQMKLSRVAIRSSESLRQLHNFLVSETQTGDISRQETVSMIPPLLLQVEPHHKVLDMCAAPGSKTAQLIEFLHRDEGKMPEGLIVANDVDNKRCYMLVHQAKRLNSPCLLITNNDAGIYPNFKITEDGKKFNLKFDRILCDVPCSGDGTMRKTAEIWTKWHTANGNNMHGLQLRILRRGLELLAVGGRIVYSTCSLNPVENEAVICTILQETKGSVEIVDVRSLLPGLKSCPGRTEWKVANKEMEVFDKFEDVPEKNLTHIRPHMFPPSAEVIKDLHLEHCIRILPHHQDTGGFFVAVLEKKDKLPWEKSSENGVSCEEKSPPQKKRKVWGYKEDPFVFLDENDEIFPKIKEFYNLKDFPSSQLLSRCKEGKKRNLYLTSKIVKNIMENNLDTFKIINTGLRILSRSENKDTVCIYRFTQEGISTVLPFMGEERKVTIEKEDLITCLTNEYPAHSLFTESMQAKLPSIVSGCVVLCYTGNVGKDDEFKVELCGWKGNQTLRCYVPKVGRAHYLRICGVDVSEYEMREKKKFKIKDESGENVDEEMLEESENNEIISDELLDCDSDTKNVIKRADNAVIS
ncbi:RNA cytosine-C(5)-methyltransferase NSUN2 isoform X2 [Parasteatoda tepidariorum]|uniref:RNA cytosine-C(5)-methyltransferase NSUN2 isoform X2 n=1 Tax=Parasteatoda tepidariorum TaxID=114398 RepID=UPI0039BD333D